MYKRKLKFRVWNFTYNRFLKDFKLNQWGGVLYGLRDILLENVLIQQFTGFSDKNDTEIYEGDIVELHFPFLDSNVKGETLAVVTHYENGFYLKSINSDVFFQDTIYQFKNCKVIGNIFENTDLLA